jgi:type IV pilus assembly protein PilZ
MASDEKEGSDRRSHERFPASISVDYSSGDNFLFSYVENISEMGIFIRSDDPMPIGTSLDLRFKPEDGEAVDLQGEVVWINPVRIGGENINPGMGVQFRNLSDQQRELVVELVKTIAYLNEGEN